MAERRRRPFLGFPDLRRRARSRLGSGLWMAGPVLATAVLLFVLDRLGARLERAGSADATHGEAPRQGIGAGAGTGTSRPSEESLSHGHELANTNPMILFWLGLGLLAAIGFLLVGLWYLQGSLAGRAEPFALRPMTMPRAGNERFLESFRSRAPGLFPDPSGDLRAFRDKEAEKLTRYGWSDRPRGAVTIPVERAMTLIAERGLPTWDSHGSSGGSSDRGGGSP